MAYSITTKDGITINNIPDDVAPDSADLKARVAAIRAGGGAAALEPPAPTPTEQPKPTGFFEGLVELVVEGFYFFWEVFIFNEDRLGGVGGIRVF